MTMYVRLTERNDQEGETWRFYIPIEGNEAAIALVARAVDILSSTFGDVSYMLTQTPIDEETVDTLIKNGNDVVGYMAAHTKLAGVLIPPGDVLMRARDLDDNPLYKGEIRNWMHKG